MFRFNIGTKDACRPERAELRAKDGEEQEMTNFEELYEKYANDVLRVSYFYLGDRQRAEDVCQDVFVRLMTNAPNLQEGHEKAWLLKVARTGAGIYGAARGSSGSRWEARHSSWCPPRTTISAGRTKKP